MNDIQIGQGRMEIDACYREKNISKMQSDQDKINLSYEIFIYKE